MSNRTNPSEKKWIVVILILLSLCGTALCGWNLIRTFQSPLTLLGVLSSAIQFLSYLALLAFKRIRSFPGCRSRLRRFAGHSASSVRPGHFRLWPERKSDPDDQYV